MKSSVTPLCPRIKSPFLKINNVCNSLISVLGANKHTMEEAEGLGFLFRHNDVALRIQCRDATV